LLFEERYTAPRRDQGSRFQAPLVHQNERLFRGNESLDFLHRLVQAMPCRVCPASQGDAPQAAAGEPEDFCVTARLGDNTAIRIKRSNRQVVAETAYLRAVGADRFQLAP